MKKAAGQTVAVGQAAIDKVPVVRKEKADCIDSGQEEDLSIG